MIVAGQVVIVATLAAMFSLCSTTILLDDGRQFPLTNLLEWQESAIVRDAYIVDLLIDETVFSYCDLNQYTPTGVERLLAHHRVPHNATWVAFQNGIRPVSYLQ
jgi:hypothetical protein